PDFRIKLAAARARGSLCVRGLEGEVCERLRGGLEQGDGSGSVRPCLRGRRQKRIWNDLIVVKFLLGFTLPGAGVTPAPGIGRRCGTSSLFEGLGGELPLPPGKVDASPRVSGEGACIQLDARALINLRDWSPFPKR